MGYCMQRGNARGEVIGGSVFGPLTVAYLFLGGAGTGAVVVATALDLTVARTPFGPLSTPSLDYASPVQRGVAFSQVAGFTMLFVAVACLVFDLGRIDRLASLFLSPTFSVMTVGAFSLALCLVTAAGLAVLYVAYVPDVPAPVVRVLQVAALISGAAVMLYTGILLCGLGGVPLWSSGWLVALFAASSFSCGVAIVLLAMASQQQDDLANIMCTCRLLLHADLAAVVLETVAATGLISCALNGSDAAMLAAQQLLHGRYAAWWWAFAACGIVVPLALEALALARRVRVQTATVLAIAAIAVLVGGIALRQAVVGAGEHPRLALEAPQTTQTQLESSENQAASI